MGRMNPTATFTGPGMPLQLHILGTDDDGALRLAVDATDLGRLIGDGWFHASADVFAADLTKSSPTEPAPQIWLRTADDVPAAMTADHAAAWLGEVQGRTDTHGWFIAAVEFDGVHHRSLWDQLGADGADPTVAAAQFLGGADVTESLAVANRLLDGLVRETADRPLAQLAQMLTDVGVEHRLLGDEGPLGFVMDGNGTQWDVLAETVDDDHWLVAYALLPGTVPAADRAASVTRCAEVNARMKLGTLLFDTDDGNFLYRIGTDLGRPDGRAEIIGALLDRINAEVQACLAACADLLPRNTSE